MRIWGTCDHNLHWIVVVNSGTCILEHVEGWKLANMSILVHVYWNMYISGSWVLIWQGRAALFTFRLLGMVPHLCINGVVYILSYLETLFLISCNIYLFVDQWKRTIRALLIVNIGILLCLLVGLEGCVWFGIILSILIIAS